MDVFYALHPTVVSLTVFLNVLHLVATANLLNDVYTCAPVRNTCIAYMYAIHVLRTGAHV